MTNCNLFNEFRAQKIHEKKLANIAGRKVNTRTESQKQTQFSLDDQDRYYKNK